jgi:hypothetical protein
MGKWNVKIFLIYFVGMLASGGLCTLLKTSHETETLAFFLYVYCFPFIINHQSRYFKNVYVKTSVFTLGFLLIIAFSRFIL